MTTFGLNLYNRHKISIRKLKFEELYNNNSFKTLAEFHTDGLPISMLTWFRLQLMANNAIRSYTRIDNNKKKTILIENFLGNIKKGSKKFRIILDKKPDLDADPHNLRIVTTFMELTNTINQSERALKRCLGSWNHVYFDNNIREFLFKFRNNQLGLNNRINAFDPTHDPRCNFCKIRDNTTRTRDSFIHLFYQCQTTNSLLRHLLNLFEPVPDMNTNMFYNMYWYGCYDENPTWEFTLNIVFDVFRFLVFKHKLRRKIPNSLQFINELKFILEITARRNQSIRVALLANNMIANLLPALG
jgi:hypothetical protein